MNDISQCWSWPVILVGPGPEIFMLGIFMGFMLREAVNTFRWYKDYRRRKQAIQKLFLLKDTDMILKKFEEKTDEFF